jgi:acetyl esterase/lipase
MFIEPKELSYEDFPESDLSTEGMKTIKADITPRFCTLDLNVEYAVKDGHHLKLQILQPVLQGENDQRKFPLVIYIQGSAWFQQALGMTLPQLLTVAKRGYVVAIVEYRPSPVAPFPAQIKDTKTAIRFMVKNATKYNADPGKLIVWGDSSGGHTTAMVNVTMDNQEYDDESVSEDPLDVKVFVDYYGPTEISRMNEQPSTQHHLIPDSPEGSLIGGVRVDEHPELVKPTVPMNHIHRDKKLRPMIILHGTKDRLVPFQQSVLLYEALRDAGQSVEFHRLQGADHAGPPFWTKEVLDIVEDFIKKHI